MSDDTPEWVLTRRRLVIVRAAVEAGEFDSRPVPGRLLLALCKAADRDFELDAELEIVRKEKQRLAFWLRENRGFVEYAEARLAVTMRALQAAVGDLPGRAEDVETTVKRYLDEACGGDSVPPKGGGGACA